MTGSCTYGHDLARMPFMTQMDGQLAFLGGPSTVDTALNCLILRNRPLPKRLIVQYFILFLDQHRGTHQSDTFGLCGHCFSAAF
jgi:hypothetical protein